MSRLTLGIVLLSTVASPATVEFNRDIRPIFSDRCFSCHGPDAAKRASKLRLDRDADAKADLGSGRRGLIPGDPERSEVYRRVTSSDAALRMPPAYAGHAALPAVEIGLIRRWIEQGAVYQPHWSFLGPKKAAVPAGVHPIDYFVRARLEREGLKASPEADRAMLIRRVTLDLTGLPPKPSEVDAFLKDSSAGAYERVVDRLLASPRYAERMAIRWLEAARYADTNGYQSDGPRDMWRWRDWVIDAFHRNMPFDQFTIEQIAGDLLPNATLSQKIATGFHRNHRTTAEGGIVDEEFRVEYVADRVETTSTVWLGLTLGCARCHDHKYDPFTQREFYRMFAFFNNVPEKGFVYNFGNEEPYIQAPLPDQQERLDDFDRRIAVLEQKLRSLDARIDAAYRKWERGATAAPEWSVRNGRVFHATLDGEPGEKIAGCDTEPCSLPVQEGVLGKARRFDGKQFLETDGDAAKFNYRDPFTFAAWIKPESPKGAILSHAEDYFEGTGHSLHLIDGRIRLHVVYRWTDLGMRVETKNAVRLNQWQHVLATYDGKMKASGVRIYLNGEPQEVNILFDQCVWPLDPKVPFRIGAGGGLRFQGAIDDVRVYARALTPDESAVVALRDSISQIAALDPASRSKAQSGKLRMCFLERYAPRGFLDLQYDLAKLRDERQRFFETIPTVMVMAEREKVRPTFILKRGAYDAPGEPVTPGVPAILPPLGTGWPANRLGLARWLADRSNPLTARVAVNRYWQMLFGAGLVKTVEDFGSQGEWPLHLDLLDWLATEFMDSGWNVKSILKTIVTSQTYRQSSKVTPGLLQKDPENRLLARGPRLRLSPEIVRDQALALSGLLVEKTGGPSVKPYQPAGLWQELFGGAGYQPDQGEGLWRRSLYTYWKRTIAPPGMVNFDSPNRETCVVRETRTNTPLQALDLMNDVVYVEAARKLAERMLLEGGATPQDRIAYAWRLALARPPRDREAQAASSALERFQGYYRAHPKDAADLLTQGEAPRNPRLDATELAAYAGIASLVLNLDETVTKE